MGKQEQIKLDRVTAAYNGSSILNNISLSIPKGTIQIIIGPSGAGKTTLLKVINGLLKPGKGNVTVFGDSLDYSRIALTRKEIGYIPQHLGLINNMTVMENVLMGSLSRVSTFDSVLKNFPKKEIELAEHLMSTVGLKDKKEKKVSYLSGGEKRRVAIARAFMQKPKILLADEILSDLDFYKVGQITNELQKLKDEFGVTIIMVEHDLKIARTFGEKIAIIRDGKIKGNFNRKEVTNDLLYDYFSK